MSDTIVFDVPGMSCGHCVASITKEVQSVDGVQSVDVDLDTKKVTVVGGERGALVAAIDEAGFDVAS
ncbi:MAG: heavy-metal-associated domain-containing protein [Acidimicrobiales bacterium]|nr:heavy-metal-associated domain-containing protein [Acidimicrobiales bacterium]